MDRLTSLRVFREVVESGSFVAAAERLSMSPLRASTWRSLKNRSVHGSCTDRAAT